MVVEYEPVYGIDGRTVVEQVPMQSVRSGPKRRFGGMRRRRVYRFTALDLAQAVGCSEAALRARVRRGRLSPADIAKIGEMAVALLMRYDDSHATKRTSARMRALARKRWGKR